MGHTAVSAIKASSVTITTRQKYGKFTVGSKTGIYTQQNDLRFSICLTLKVILSKLKIIFAFKGPLKSFLDKMNN